MSYFTKTIFTKTFLAAAAALLFCAVGASGARASAVVDPEPDLQFVMGDLCALSVAMRLYHDDSRTEQCPTLGDLAHYFKKPLPEHWPQEYRTAQVGEDWWVGRKVGEFSRARKFLRGNAEKLGLYDKESMSAWLGGSFVWTKAVSFERQGKQTKPNETLRFSVAQGKGKDSRHLFFNIVGTEHYWWSNLLYTPEAFSAALKKFSTASPNGQAKTGTFVVPPPPGATPENITASPVSPPPDFTVGGDEETGPAVEIGDVIFNPIPRTKDDDR